MHSVKKSIGIYVLLLILFLPLPLSNLNLNLGWTEFIFQQPIEFLAKILNLKMAVTDFSSDSVSLFLLVVLLLFCSLLLSLVKIPKKFHVGIDMLARFYLILILLAYGLNKVLGWQFPFPEANVLFAPFGFLQKDILYWSTLGLSPFYTISIGLIECLIALLIFIDRTRLLGLLMAFFSFLYILLINISFDISVKIYSTLLLVITTYQLLNYRENMKVLFAEIFKPKAKNSPLIDAVKLFVFFVILSIVSVPYLLNFNANQAFSASFELINKKCTKEHDNWGIEKIFFLQQGYVVFQDRANKMDDYKLIQIDPKLIVEKEGRLYDFQIERLDEKMLILHTKYCEYHFQAISTDELPINQHQNHFFIDDVK